MTLTQSTRLPGPSWDEEVVPALRKRLESESRTLARRISGISLSSVDELPLNQNYQPNTALNEKRENVASSSQQLGAPKLHTPQHHYSDRNGVKTTIPRVNGSESSSKLKFERTRTYSSPYSSGLSNGQALPNGNTNASKSTEPPRTSISRPSDVKPTRIPKAARGGSFSNGHSPHMNGQSHNPNLVTPPSQHQSPEIPNQPFPEQRGPQRGVLATPPSTRTKVELPSHPGILLLNESPPFTSISSMSSYGHEPNQTDPPRSSIDSEERPFEHWYRGEVSRNGGVGELRVGRRQEMLDIANYGHAIRKKKKPTTTRVQPINSDERYRKRADSIGGMTDKEREERGSLYLDDEHASEVGRVLDESPLTDLDGDGSDVNSDSEYYNGPYAYIPEVEDNLTPMPEPWTPTAGTGEARSLTPISVPSSSMIPRPSSRQQQQQQQQQQQSAPPTRIPTLSTSRRSSDSRRSATSPTPAPMIRGASEPPQLPPSKTPSPPATSSSSKARQQTYASNTLPTSAQKTAMSPASKKSRTTASKATRAKASAARKEQDEESNKKSMAYYPTPTGQGDDNMADAIPSWTQPKHGEGNWDEVILPVVARKKGLDEHYESADGNPQPKKVVNYIAPAPGTFGYNHSKYRPPRNDYEPMMDEFGQQRSPSEQDHQEKPPDVVPLPPTMHEEPKKPLSSPTSPAPRFDHRVAPFADSVMLSQHQQQQSHSQSEKEVSGGCCKCIIM